MLQRTHTGSRSAEAPGGRARLYEHRGRTGRYRQGSVVLSALNDICGYELRRHTFKG